MNPPVSDRQNSFTFLRQVFALLVVFAHCFPLGGFGLDPLQRVSGGKVQLGFVAVLCFFVVSGFLISRSALTQPLWRYFLNRMARIVPGLWVNLALTAFVLAPVLISLRYPGRYGYWESVTLGPASALEYLKSNWLFHVNQYRIGPILHGLPGGPAVNGSLWSLGSEVMCYLYLAVLAAGGLLRVRVVVLGIFLSLWTLHGVAHFDEQAIREVARIANKGWVIFGHPLFRALFVAFAAGMVYFQFRHWLRWDWRWFSAVAAVFAASIPLGLFDFVWPWTLPYVVLCLAYRLPLHRVEEWGDFSYGIYIYSFPIQQCLVLAGLPRLGFVPFALVSLALSVVAGMLSWRFVERPVLEWARSLAKARAKAPAEPAPEPAV